MKRFIAILLTINTLCGFAQTDPVNDFQRHQVGFSFGVFSHLGIFDNSRYDGNFFRLHDDYDDNGYRIEAFNTGTFTLFYRYQLAKRHALGLQTTLGFRYVTKMYHYNPGPGLIKGDNDQNQVQCSLNTYLALQASYRFTVKQFPCCSFFLGGDAGFSLYLVDEPWQQGTPLVTPTIQLIPLSVSIGKRNAAVFEFGFGTQGMFNLGYSCRF